VGLTASLAIVAMVLLVKPDRLFQRRPSDDTIISLAEEQFQKAEVPYQQALDQLLRLSRPARDGLDPSQKSGYDAALSALSAETRRRLGEARQRPADATAQERLYAAYRREIAFLQDSLLRGPAVAAKSQLAQHGIQQVAYGEDTDDYGWGTIR
jgi:hypothetical protein